MEKLIRDWSIKHELDTKHPHTQFTKMIEEQGELAEALVKKKSMADVKDAIGDVYVTLVILAQQLGLTVEECAKVAYDEIKDRQGITIGDTFIKMADLDDDEIVGAHYYEQKRGK